MRAAICKEYGFSWNELHWKIPLSVIQRITIDSAVYEEDDDSKGVSNTGRGTSDKEMGPQEFISFINSISPPK